MGIVSRMIVRWVLALMLVIQLEANSTDIGDTSREDELNDKCTQKEFVAPDDMCPTNKSELDEAHVLRCKCEDPYEEAEDGIHCKRKLMCKDKKILKTCVKKSAVCEEIMTGAGYECVCRPGFDWENDTCIQKCDLKKNHDKCSALRATCELDGRYNAVCKYPPLLTQEKEDAPGNKLALCEPNPCIHRKCVLVDKLGISYNCSKSYGGIYCNSAIKVTKNKRKPNERPDIVGGVLATILDVILITGFFIYKRNSRMQKTQNDDEKYTVNKKKSIFNKVNLLRREQPSSEIEGNRELSNRDRMILRTKTFR